VGGGPPIDLCVAGDGNGGTWNQDNVIVFASAESPLQKVTSAGGVPTPVTTLDKHEVSHKWPSFLPNGQHLLYVAVKRSIVESELRVAALGSSETTSLGVAASKSQYASGHLLFPRGGSLMAVSFDPQTRQRTGDPFLVAESVRGSPPTHYSPFSASLTGVLGYVRESNSPRTSRLTWMDRAGKPLGVVGDPGRYTNLSLSPDDRGVAVSMFTGSPPNRDIWLIDLARAASSRRLTFDPAAEGDPIWSPDGSQILFNSLRALPGWSFFQHAANGGGEDKLVLQADSVVLSPDWSRVGLAYSQQSSSTGFDVWILPSGSQKPLKLTSNEFDEDNPAISPDGHWLAYDSNESGKHEVYVRPLPANDRQFKISGNGGWAPRWRRDDGKELFFLALDGWMMSAGIEMSKGFQPTEPRRLFQTGLRRTIDRHTYAVTRDGKRFLFPVLEAQSSRPITIVVNWLASVQK
jgi:Tol biopolymer transport system component